ncbi:hypothetical protein [Nocardioides pacificus]
MTTESKTDPRASGALVLLGAGVASLIATLLIAALGAVLDGRPAAYGALVGALLVTAVFAFGLQVIHVVSRLQPELSLVVAMMTYGLQVAMVTAVFARLSASGALGTDLDASWTVGGVVAAVGVWTTAQVVLSSRLRIPAYDLSLAARSPRPVAVASASLSTPTRPGER